MKWIAAVVSFIAVQSAWASPLERRASVDDVADIGWATINGGTTGGSGGSTTVVSTLAALEAAVSGDAKKIVIVTGTISGSAVVKVGPNTTVVGRNGATLDGVGLRVLEVSNVIIRNLKISKVIADVGDAIGVQAASNVWLDHLDLSSDKDHDKEYYDGLLDITHGSTGVTVSYSKLYNHYKGSLVGHSDSNGAVDKQITVTFAYNIFDNIGSRTPSLRWGSGHIYNNFFSNIQDGINSRTAAQLLVENNKWISTKKALYSENGGAAVARGNDYGGASASAPAGTLTTVPYSYTLVDASEVQSATSGSGATLSL